MELDLETVKHRQDLFSSTLQKYFQRKITKYKNTLLRSGIHLIEESADIDNALTSLNQDHSFDDEIELVIGERSAPTNSCKNFCRIGKRISTTKLFRWIKGVIQRNRAMRVLHHLDGVSDEEIVSVISEVGQELAFAYEYQLSMLDEDSEVIKLAVHAGRCITTYLKSSDAHFIAGNLLQAILEVKPHHVSNKDVLKTRTVILDRKPVYVRWKLSRVFKQPGLRISQEDKMSVNSAEAKVSEYTEETANNFPNLNLDNESNVQEGAAAVEVTEHCKRVTDSLSDTVTKNCNMDSSSGGVTFSAHENDCKSVLTKSNISGQGKNETFCGKINTDIPYGIEGKSVAETTCKIWYKATEENTDAQENRHNKITITDKEITYPLTHFGDEIELLEIRNCGKITTEALESSHRFKFYGCFTPFGAKCKPKSYGYRWPLHAWNEKKGCFTMVYNDEVTARQGKEIPFNEKHIHHLYIPKTACKHGCSD